jgi:hypothetical protein
MTSVAASTATAVVLACEDKAAFGFMAHFILQVNEAGQYGIRENVHGEMNNPVKHIIEGLVLALSLLDDLPVLGHVLGNKVQLQAWRATRNPNLGHGVSR